jgi:hypothetical protein
MAEQYAILDQANGHLVNVVLWDGDTAKWQPPAGTSAVRLADIDLATLPPAPSPEAEPITAEAWVEQHLTSTQLHALSDLRLSLVLAGKPLGPLMQSLRDWTSQLIVASAADPSPRSDWPVAPCSYEAASAEAIAALASNP